jgi:hypothetical protein
MNKKAFFLIMLLVILLSCKEKSVENKIEFHGLNERKIEIVNEVKFEGFISGADFEHNELYIQSIHKLKRVIRMLIVDIDEGKIKMEKHLSIGAQESPTDFFNPAFMQRLGDRYFIIDQYRKIACYDSRFEYLFTNMFNKHRYFLDFFLNKGNTFLVVGAKRYFGIFNTNDIQVYKFRENQRPVHVKDLHVFKNKSLSRKARINKKNLYAGAPWPSGLGFEKDGKIYYANNDENVYYTYDIEDKSKQVYKLDYLKAKKYSKEVAWKIKFFYSDGWHVRLMKRTGKKYIVETHPEPLYHFGIFDIGKNKIGIIGDLDTDNFKFRLDVLEASTGKYLESIRLPFGNGFTQNISTSAQGFHHIFINIDRGYYLWNNVEGEDFDDYARITYFKILPEEKSKPMDK